MGVNEGKPVGYGVKRHELFLYGSASDRMPMRIMEGSASGEPEVPTVYRGQPVGFYLAKRCIIGGERQRGTEGSDQITGGSP